MKLPTILFNCLNMRLDNKIFVRLYMREEWDMKVGATDCQFKQQKKIIVLIKA